MKSGAPVNNSWLSYPQHGFESRFGKRVPWALAVGAIQCRACPPSPSDTHSINQVRSSPLRSFIASHVTIEGEWAIAFP